MTRTIAGLFVIAAFVLAGALLLRGSGALLDAVPSREAGIDPGPASRPRGLRLLPVDAPRIGEVGGAASRARPPHRGIRGVVASPRVVLPDGSCGVDPGAWEARVYALVPSASRRSVDRIGIAHLTAPRSPRGDFQLDLPTGSYLVQVEHRTEAPGGGPLVEAWYAYAEIAVSDVTPRDLGRHEFATPVIAGAVVDGRGDACAGARVEFSDEVREAGSPLTRGVFLSCATGEGGRFAFSVRRGDGQDVVGRLAASRDGAEARRDRVRPGAFVDLVLAPTEPLSEVVFEIPWAPCTTVWIYAVDRRCAFVRQGGRTTETGLIEERRRLPPGRWIVEIFRRAEAAGDEWARVALEIDDARPRRVRVEPVFERARTVTGTAPKGIAVSWVTRISDGSTFRRDLAITDDAGRFTLRGLPTAEVLLSVGSVLIPVPPGREPELDLGELQSG